MGPRWRRLELRSPEPIRFHPGPTYLLLRSAEELDEAYGVKAWSTEVDWRNEVVLAVERGECPTGGYTVAIQDVSVSPPDTLLVRVAMSDPSPDDFVTMAFTYPRAAVAVNRRDLDNVARVTFADAKGRTLHTAEVAR